MLAWHLRLRHVVVYVAFTLHGFARLLLLFTHCHFPISVNPRACGGLSVCELK